MHSARSPWFYVSLLPLLLVPIPAARSSAPQAPPESTPPAMTRPCTTNPILAPSTKTKASKKSKHPLPPETPPVCIEMKGEAIEIQEFLQSFVREQQWHIGDNRASEDSWSFVRYLNVEQLENYADTKVLLESVEFTNGKTSVVIRTSDVSDGYVRVQITAHFQGEGKSTDKLWSQPGNVWPLNSKGVLEQELTSALQTRYKHAA
jgi:hypothetical protein